MLKVINRYLSKTKILSNQSSTSSCKGFCTASNYKSTFYVKDLTIQKTTKYKQQPLHDENLKFGAYSTDHMLETFWNSTTGWGNPQIVPYHNLSLDPFNSTLHYAIECFEGMKAYIDAKGKIRVFRPDMNAQRFQSSCERISLPGFNEQEFVECLKELVKVDKNWIPKKKGFSMYIRPTAISLTDVLGVRAPDKSMLFIVLSPVGPYYPTGFKPIALYTDDKVVRAFPGGSAHFKIGANYGPTIRNSRYAEEKGYNQILWLTGDLVTEVGTSNVFFFWKNEQGEEELVTPPLNGLILPGVIRDSILQITRKMNKFKVTERNLTIHEVIKSIKEKRLIEAFGAGTAATVAPIKLFYYKGTDYKVPINESIGAGQLTKELSDHITAIQYGIIEHPWSVLVDQQSFNLYTQLEQD